jgi:hypothetical protein
MSDNVKSEILEELAIGPDLSLEFERQAPYFASWGFDHATAEAEARRTEEAKDVMGARLGKKFRREHKAPKEAEVKEYVTRHPAYRRAVKAWHDAKFARDILRIAVESFKQRKDMLVQLGADKRAELDQTDLSLRKKTRRATKILREVMQDKTTKAKKKRKRSREDA